jgi:hypothetical protein
MSSCFSCLFPCISGFVILAVAAEVKLPAAARCTALALLLPPSALRGGFARLKAVLHKSADTLRLVATASNNQTARQRNSLTRHVPHTQPKKRNRSGLRRTQTHHGHHHPNCRPAAAPSNNHTSGGRVGDTNSPNKAAQHATAVLQQAGCTQETGNPADRYQYQLHVGTQAPADSFDKKAHNSSNNQLMHTETTHDEVQAQPSHSCTRTDSI